MTSSRKAAMLASMGYPGGKAGAGVYQALINHMPPHEVYIEPFAGGAAVLRAKRPARLNIAVDADAEVILELASLKRSMADPPDPLARNGDSAGRIAGSSEARGHRQISRGNQVELVHGDGIQFLQAYRFRGPELVYCDPPYLPETRRSRRALYRWEMNVGRHRQLLRVLRSLPCMAMISGYWSELYAAELANWHRFSFQAMTRGGRPATEWCWSNFPAPLRLHDYRYLGANFRERERIRRRQRRWSERLARMPALERQALLAAIDARAAPEVAMVDGRSSTP